MTTGKTQPPSSTPLQPPPPPSYNEAVLTPSTTTENTTDPLLDFTPNSSVHVTPSTSTLSLSTTTVTSKTRPTWKGPSPPPGTQRARAPLTVERSSHKIVENFLVKLDDWASATSSTAPTPSTSNGKPGAPPDVYLHTTNSKIVSGVWAGACAWKRPFRFEARTTNSKIVLSVHTLVAHQAVDIRATYRQAPPCCVHVGVSCRR